jgi:hypothetical protein
MGETTALTGIVEQKKSSMRIPHEKKETVQGGEDTKKPKNPTPN